MNDNCCDFITSLLRQVQDPMSDVVIVCDNAPVHVNIEAVMEEEEFNGADLISTKTGTL